MSRPAPSAPHAPRRPGRRLAVRAVGLALTLAAAPAPAELIFTDVTEQAGVALPGTLTESVAWADYDRDGDPDLYLTNDGPNVLLRNDGGDRFTDVTEQAGVGHGGFSVGAAFGDLDNDGDLDLYVVSFGIGGDVVYRNDGPIGPEGVWTFTDVTAAAGTDDESSSRGVTLVDYDRDGLLDLYVNAIGPDILYRNLGGLRFANVAGELGVGTAGQGVGVTSADLDDNGWPDLFTGNRSGLPNRLYSNVAGTFLDLTEAAGIDKVGLGMGVLAFDYDNDLDLDLYWTTWPGTGPEPQPNALYRNDSPAVGALRFTDVTTGSGTADPLGWGISCNAADVDNDGLEDFFVTNGFSPDSGPNRLFLNRGDGTFADVSAVLGNLAFDGRGVAFADYDRDGDLDLCVTGGPSAETRLWRNDSAPIGRHLVLELRGRVSNASAVGARITVETDRRVTVKEVTGPAGRGSQNDLPVEFGLGDAGAIRRVVIRWPSGIETVLEDVELDRRLVIEERAGIRRRAPRPLPLPTPVPVPFPTAPSPPDG